MLVGDMALVGGAVIRRICEEMDIEVIDMAVNPGHLALFIKYPPKHFISYLSRMVKMRSSREFRKELTHLKYSNNWEEQYDK